MGTYIEPGIYTQETDVSFYYNGEKAIETTKDGLNIYWAHETSSSPSNVSDNRAAVEQSLRVYADLMAERIEEGNLDEVDKNSIAGLIYAILMKEDYPEYVRDGLLKDKEERENEFKDEDFLL